MGNWLGGRCRIRVLLRKIGDAIVCRAGGVDQCDQLRQGVDRDEDRTRRQEGAGRTIRHPHRNRRGLLVLITEPDITAMPYAPPHDDRLAMQRMPGIVNGDLLSVVGGM